MRHEVVEVAAQVLDTAIGALTLTGASNEHADEQADERAGARATLQAHRARLDEPIRVAIAGRMKSGKSTLINAVIGEEIAPTDATECTRVITWYRHGGVPTITVHPREGKPRPQPVKRVEGRLVIGTGGLSHTEIDHIDVTWPAPALKSMSLIDTPGIGSLSSEVSARSHEFLGNDADAGSQADAVVYLLRHLHRADVDFLESFADRQVAQSGPATTLGVLSRADEVGAGRIDALLSAADVAAAYRDDVTIRSLCLDVVPLAGLLAQTGRTLRQNEFDLLSLLAQLGRTEREDLLLSADRFAQRDVPALAEVSAASRAALLDRLGVFGIRLSTNLIRAGFRDAPALADELARRSGLDHMVDLIRRQFTERADVLKARTALLAARRYLDGDSPTLREAALMADRALIETHELTEMHWLARLRSERAPDLGADALAQAEQLIGANGTSTSARLGPKYRDVATQRQTAMRLIGEWRAVEGDPLAPLETRALCRVVIRSLEGVVADLSTPGAQQQAASPT